MTAAVRHPLGPRDPSSSAGCGAAGEVAADLLVSSAVLHAAPAAAAVLALVDEEPLAAIALLDPLERTGGEQGNGRMHDRPQGTPQLLVVGPAPCKAALAADQLGSGERFGLVAA